MSETENPTGPTTATDLDPVTEEIFIPAPGVGGTHAEVPAGPGHGPWDDGLGADDDEWPERGPRQGVRMSVATVVLVALLIAAGGIWGGAALQRSEGTSGGSAGASSLASLFGARTGGAAAGTAGGFGALAGATTGTVTEVSGSTLYVTDASGALVKVTVGPSATVTREATSSLGSLQVGDTVIVEGTKASDGTVTATSVAATAAGVTSPFARFGAGGTAAGG